MIHQKSEMSYEQVQNAEDKIVECLGHDGAFEALTKAMSYDQKEDFYKYIIRMYDIPFAIDEEE